MSGADDEPEADRVMAENFEPEADRVMASDEPEADRVMAEEFELSQESGGELVPQHLFSRHLGNLT